MPQPVQWEERRIHNTDTISLRPIAVGMAALLVGTLVYLTDRNPETIIFFKELPGVTLGFAQSGRWWGPLGGILPDFFHAFAFALITAGVLGRHFGMHGLACLFWFFVNTLFELGQKFPDQAMALIPDCWMTIKPVQWASVYVSKGTFDPLDILAFAAGSIAAFALLSVMNKKE